MVLDHITGILTHPNEEWVSIRQEKRSRLIEYLLHVPFLAWLPCISFFIGVHYIGWQLPGSSSTVALTMQSAAWLCVLSYLAAMAGVWIFGEFINWMHKTYSDEPENPHHSMSLAIYVTAPLFIAGIAGVWPNFWFNATVTLIAASYSVYLIYRGIPILMNIPKERAFLYSTSVFTVALVMLVTLRVASVIFWSIGFGPEYVTLAY